MATYSVMHIVHASTSTEVEADSVEEAMRIAESSAHCSVCHHCSDHIEISDLGAIVQVINQDTDECFSVNEAGEVEAE